MPEIAAPAAPVGRPRDGRIDEAVLRATAELVEEVGYARLSLAAIAARAGTTKPALYRRWASKAQLVHEAVFPAGDAELIPDSGDLTADVRRMVLATIDLFGRPAVRAALPGLLADLTADPDLHARLLERFAGPAGGAMRARLDRAVAAGEVRAGVDPDVLLEMIGGTAFLALAIRPRQALDDTWVDATVDLVLKGIAR